MLPYYLVYFLFLQTPSPNGASYIVFDWSHLAPPSCHQQRPYVPLGACLHNGRHANNTAFDVYCFIYLALHVKRLQSDRTRTSIERNVSKLVGLSGLKERVQSNPDAFAFTIAERTFHWDRQSYTAPYWWFRKLRLRIDISLHIVHCTEQPASEKTTQRPKAPKARG